MLRVMREHPAWCDDIGTPAAESCDDAIAPSLERALDWIARRQGPDINAWQWGREHPAAHRHALFDGLPLLRELASVRFPSDGGMHTINRAQPSFRGPRPFEAVHGAGYKASTISPTSTTAASPCRSASRATCCRRGRATSSSDGRS